MTVQERCREMLPVIQAGAEGRAIQFSVLPSDQSMFPWTDITDMGCGHGLSIYELRIKPEPRYRPFTPEEAAKELLGVDINRAGECAHSYVVAIKERGVSTHYHGDISYESLATEFLNDGTPCGVLTD